ncbi:hypothetical protein HZS_5064, partial [Henneguya salminicola]
MCGCVIKMSRVKGKNNRKRDDYDDIYLNMESLLAEEIQCDEINQNIEIKDKKKQLKQPKPKELQTKTVKNTTDSIAKDKKSNKTKPKRADKTKNEISERAEENSIQSKNVNKKQSPPEQVTAENLSQPKSKKDQIQLKENTEDSRASTPATKTTNISGKRDSKTKNKASKQKLTPDTNFETKEQISVETISHEEFIPNSIEKSDTIKNHAETVSNDLVEKTSELSIIETNQEIKLSRKEEKKRQKKEKFSAETKLPESVQSQFTVSQQQTLTKNDDSSGDVKVQGLSISAAGKLLLDNADLILAHGHRYGLVGPNGMGKTTLLNHIASRSIKLPTNLDVLLCEQDIEVDETPAISMVLKADTKRLELIQQAINILRLSGKRGLGFDSEMQNRPVVQFSGGWRMRVSLARALFIRPSLLLLDEPTNHLDLNAVIWLENYLCDYDKTLLVVSHDQYFLDMICTDIIHLDSKKLYSYKGNYVSFKKMYEQKFKEKVKAFDQQKKQIKQLKNSGKSTKDAEKAVMASLKKKKEKGGKISTEQSVGIGGMSVEQTLMSQPREYTVKFTIPNPPKLNPPILGLQDVTFSYGKKSPIFKNVNFGIDMSSRIAIVGPNGVGKSTLLKLLTGMLTPTSGEVIRNPRLKIGYFSQHSGDQLIMDITPSNYIQQTFNLDYQSSRQELSRFGLAAHAHVIKMNDLSGGQKSRVALCDMTLRSPDVIILDEPTNNLDIESIDALSAAINKYEGGVIIVSHDARMIVETDCYLWVVENQNIDQIDGDFEDYRCEVLETL